MEEVRLSGGPFDNRLMEIEPCNILVLPIIPPPIYVYTSGLLPDEIKIKRAFYYRNLHAPLQFDFKYID